MRKINKDNFPHLLNCTQRAIYKRYYSLIGRLFAKWWGVELCPNIIFNGKPIFRRHPNSSIQINKSCTFNSSCNSNLMGINHPCIISTLKENSIVTIGQFCGFSGTVISAAKLINIGDNVRCGVNTLITDTDWHWDDPRSGENKPVYIHNGVWLGANTVVLKGVTIGDNTFVGAGSLVVKSLPSNVIAAGSPAKVIRKLKSSEMPRWNYA